MQQTIGSPASEPVATRAFRAPSGWPLAVFCFTAGSIVAVFLALASNRTLWLDQLVSGPSGNEVVLRLSGSLSSLGNTEGQTAVVAVVMAVLCTQHRVAAAAYVWAVAIVVGFTVRAFKATFERDRPLPRESDYFIDPMIRRGSLLLLLGLVAGWWLWRRRASSVVWLAGLLPLTMLVDRSTGLIPVTGEAASFPSGHAANSAAVAAAIVVTWWSAANRSGGGKAPVRAALAAAGVVALGVGLSRVVLGYHHVSDVVAGWCLAIALALGLRYLFEISGLIPRRGLPADIETWESPTEHVSTNTVDIRTPASPAPTTRPPTRRRPVERVRH